MFHYVGCFDDYIGQDIKTTRIWKETKGRATEVDRVIVMSDTRPSFNVGSLPQVLGLEALSIEHLRQIDADILSGNAEAFAAITTSGEEAETTVTAAPIPRDSSEGTAYRKRAPLTKVGQAKSSKGKPPHKERTLPRNKTLRVTKPVSRLLGGKNSRSRKRKTLHRDKRGL